MQKEKKQASVLLVEFAPQITQKNAEYFNYPCNWGICGNLSNRINSWLHKKSI
jgi:hypothetical protein